MNLLQMLKRLLVTRMLPAMNLFREIQNHVRASALPTLRTSLAIRTWAWIAAIVHVIFRRVLITVYRICTIRSEFLEFLSNIALLGVAVIIWCNPYVLINGHVFKKMILIHPTVSPWAWKYFVVGSCGMVALFVRCFYWARMFMSFLGALLWVWTALLITIAVWEVTLIAWFVVIFAGLALLGIVRSVFERPSLRRGASRLERAQFLNPTPINDAG